MPKTFDEKVSEIVASLPVKSAGPPLAKGKVGLILPSPIKVQTIINVGSTQPLLQTSWKPRPDPMDLRQALLFWDAIHIPEEFGPFYEDDEQIKLLAQCGLIRSVDGPNEDQIANLFGGNKSFAATQGTVPIYTQLRLNLFSSLEKQEPGQWAMGRGLASPELPLGERSAGRGMLVKLTNTLPIPAGDVHLNEILEFKEKRGDELLILRQHLADVFSKLASGDRDEMAKIHDLAAFEKSVDAYQTVLSESKIKAVATDFASTFNIIPIAAEALNMAIGEKPIIHLGIAGILGALTIAPLAGLKRRKSNEVFEYVGRYHQDIPWKKVDA